MIYLLIAFGFRNWHGTMGSIPNQLESLDLYKQDHSYLTAKDFFPLTPGDRWTYSDSLNKSEHIVDKAVIGKIEGKVQPYGVIEEFIDGSKSGEMFYRIHANTVNLVGRGIFDQFPPRPILVVGGTNDWDYYADPITPYSSVQIHVVAHSEDGTPEVLFGKLRKIVKVTDVASAGGKTGLNVHQTAIYAEGIGMIDFKQVGTAGKGKINDERKLISFHAAKNKSTLLGSN